MKNHHTTNTLATGIILLLIITGLTPLLQAQPTSHTLTTTQQFNTPTTTIQNDMLTVTLTQATDTTQEFGKPQLPTTTTIYELPRGSTITTVTFTPGPIHTLPTTTPVQPVPTPQKNNDQLIPAIIPDTATYSSTDPYPATWGWYTLGAGINNHNDYVLFLSLHTTPVHYLPAAHQLQYTTTITVSVSYTTKPTAATKTASDGLLIITPAEFKDALQPLVDHKTSHGLATTLVTLETINLTYSGRDLPEKIKYCIKDNLDTSGISYVLLVGDMKKLPIRITYASWWEANILSDLYYADIYNTQDQFCTWDRNLNNRFGEITHNGADIDGVDLYPDVNVGRLACSSITDVQNQVNKIIAYETQTTGQAWFKHIILAGGDTFPGSMDAPRGVYEGEITNTAVAATVPAFTPKFLWTSKHNLHFFTFNHAIDDGAGFVSYSGHGFEHGWGTYRPNAMTKTMVLYYTPYIKQLKNGNKLPIIFFDACLTAKLDFNITDLKHYYPVLSDLLVRLGITSNDPTVSYPCFAWSFLVKADGGAIGTIGATRTAYTHVDADGIYGGAGYLNVQFFSSYHDGVRLGQMMTGSQAGYLNGVGMDYFTLEEFLLFGDPSLMVGGFSAQ